jgi:hypothetical protein
MSKWLLTSRTPLRTPRVPPCQNTSRTHGLLAAAVAITIVCAPPVAAAQPKPQAFVITPTSVAGVPVGASTTYRAVTHRFGLSNLSVRLLPWECRLLFPNVGVGFEFQPLLPTKPTRSACHTFDFGRASVYGRQWHTTRGLHVGASLVALREAYPHATDNGLGKPPSGVTNWCAYWVIEAPRVPGPALFAYVTHGHVAALGIEVLGH